jgi:tetratricopeptide (TPR) repeat protein
MAVFRPSVAGTPLANAAVMQARRAAAASLVIVLSSALVAAQPRVSELNEAGWKALRDGYQDRAATIFAEAVSLRPNDPVLLFGWGAAAHAQGKQREAMARLGKAIEIQPGLLPASKLLGQIAFDENDVELAVTTYEAALKHAPNDPELLRSLGAWKREASAHATFEERRYERFRVMFEGRADESLAVQATRVLESAFFRIGEKLGEYPAKTIVTVLYTEKQFRDITRAPEWSGGQYDGRIRIPVAGAQKDPELFESVLTHELTHAIVAGIAPTGVPAWLNEGLAQYFDGSDPREAAQRMRSLGMSVPLKYLERGFGRLNAHQAQAAYDESLLAVSVMMDRPAFGWIRLLHRLGDGETFEEAIRNFGFATTDLEAPFTR